MREHGGEAVPDALAGDVDTAAAKALGHPIRVKILRFLLERDDCMAGEIVEELPVAQSTVSQHLKVLREAGLIYGEVDGVRICYCADPGRVEHLRNMLRDIGVAARI
jgi:ArsR family transcriptional regulator